MIDISAKFLVIIVSIFVIVYILFRDNEITPTVKPTPESSSSGSGCSLEGRLPVEKHLNDEPSEQSMRYSPDAQFIGTSLADDFYSDIQLSGTYKL